MPKRAREQASTGDVSLSDVEVDDPGHTPKWTRSSPSASPDPALTPESSSVASTDQATVNQEIQCLLPGHPPLKVASATEFEVHYTKEHSNKCIDCKANLPSSWLLDLHHKENHDPLIATKREKGEKTYQCFLQDCDKITLTPQKRRLHLIDKHGFPRNYDFRIVDSGSNGRRSLLREPRTTKSSGRRRRVSDVGIPGWRGKATAVAAEQFNSIAPMEAHPEEFKQTQALGSSKPVPTFVNKEKQPISKSPDDPMDTLVDSMSSLQFVPMSVRMKAKTKF